MSISSVIDQLKTFATEIKKESDCSQSPYFKTEGEKLYNDFIQWLPENKISEEYDTVVCYVFSLLQELQDRKALSKEDFQVLSEKAVTVIESSQGDEIDPYLSSFLKQQRIR